MARAGAAALATGLTQGAWMLRQLTAARELLNDDGFAPATSHMLRHAFVTTTLDAGVDLRDVQIAARHADPRTTTRYDRVRQNLDRHSNYILAAYMASGI